MRDAPPVTQASIAAALQAMRQERVTHGVCPICGTVLDATGWCTASLCICWFDPAVAHLRPEEGQ